MRILLFLVLALLLVTCALPEPSERFPEVGTNSDWVWIRVVNDSPERLEIALSGVKLGVANSFSTICLRAEKWLARGTLRATPFANSLSNPTYIESDRFDGRDSVGWTWTIINGSKDIAPDLLWAEPCGR